MTPRQKRIFRKDYEIAHSKLARAKAAWESCIDKDSAIARTLYTRMEKARTEMEQLNHAAPR